MVNGYSKARMIKYLDTLERIGRLLGKPFTEARKEDIVKFVRKIKEAHYSEWTKQDYLVILRIFYRWLRKTEDYPEEVRWIKIKRKNVPKLPEELLTVDEVMKLINVADHIRDKAFILTLYESGLGSVNYLI